jgi:hypothetical protein
MLSVHARRLAVLLAALTALVLTGCAAVTTTSGPTSVGVQNRVWAFTPAAQLLAPATTSQSSCSRPGFTGATAGLASGFCVAAEDAGKSADFIAGPSGSEPPVPVSQSRMASGLDEAGLPSTPTSSPGTEYGLPDGTKVRLMQPSGQAPLRASFTNADGQPINPFTGQQVPEPAPPGWTMRGWVRALSHVEQTP